MRDFPRFTVPTPLRSPKGGFVLEHLAKIAAVDPAAAGRASDEMLGSSLGGRLRDCRCIFRAGHWSQVAAR